ncbi:MAG: DivIVA domain-containing protein [Ignavibacteriaceae bacterium]|nr:DivIVA domain-containing protein [Ignavibacteriaceae bacterium]
MKFSPISIKKQEFAKKLRGYDTEEVHAFLERIADEVETLQKDNDSLKKELEEANLRLSDFKRIEKTLQDTLIKTQESSIRSIESTKKQAMLMIKEAEIKASQIAEKAREQANDIRNSVINLREERDLILAKLKAIINSQAHLLEMKVEDAGEEKVEIKPLEQSKKVDIDVNDILDKII